MARQLGSKSQASGLYSHTGYWLDRLRGLVHGSFGEALAGHDVSIAQWSVLITLYRAEATTPKEVARLIGVDAGALTRLLDRLEAKGLLRRVPAPGDRRSLNLELTEEALAITPRLAVLADGNDKAFFGALDGHEDATFRFLLAKLLRSRGIDVPEAWSGGGMNRALDR
jgi:MarR family transcriptional regulator, organic hydroperoxide resistance regulator